ncbi:MAG: HD domain-containing protein [Proteobacteria bacterium]|nr:HD domain-containing protein [Pseudomonadota bacterium]
MHRYRKIISKLLILFILTFYHGDLPAETNRKAPSAKNGVLDLSQWSFKKDGLVRLYGEWRFFWKTFLPVDQLPQSSVPGAHNYLTIPSYWNDYEINGQPISGQGYGTFSLTVLLPGGTKKLAFKIKEIKTAYRLYVNGELVTGDGQVGIDSESSIPFYRPHVAEFQTDQSEIEILIHVSNFHHRLGGIWEEIILGDEPGIRNLREEKLIHEIFLMGCILIMGLYHLGLFLNRKKDTSALHFGFFCLIIAVRTLTLGERYFVSLFSIDSWEVLHTIEFLTFYTAVMAFATFLYTLYPREFNKALLRLVQVISILFSIITIITPAIVYTQLLEVYQTIAVLAGLYYTYVLIRAVINKKEGGWIILLGFIVLFVMSINEILHTNQVIHTGYFVPIGLFVFIFSQAFMIALRFSKSFLTVEHQAWELIKTNDAFRNEIKERKKLEQNLVESHENFEKSRVGIILGLAKLAEYRDEDTGTHLERMREYSKLLAEELSLLDDYKNYITDEYIADLFQSAILHDIGKVGIPDSILLKPGKLTPNEFKIMQQHSVIGGDAILNIESRINMKSFLTLGKEIAYNHHEKWDGSGYPKGLKGRDIPLSARIIALADVYDALTSERPYKKAFSHEKSRTIILEGKGKHFDPAIVEAFLICEGEFKSIRNQFLDTTPVIPLVNSL